MPSFTAISAAAILAFSGMASAIPQYNFKNGTAPANTTSPVTGGAGSGSGSGSGANSTTPIVGGSNSTSPALDGKFCPGLDLSIYIDRSGFSYRIECDTNHFGTIIDITLNLTRRAVPSSLDDCLNLCDATSTCVGTAFNTQARSCTLYSDVQAAYSQQGVQFAQRVAAGGNGAGSNGNGAGANNGATTISAGGSATSTIYSTNVVTISSCAPTVTNCPLNAVVTQVIPVAETVYVCPTQTVIPASPIACTSCPYTASVATVYSASAGSMVPVNTQVVAVPCPTGTTITVEVCTSCAKTTGPAGAMSTVPAANTQTLTVCKGNCPASYTGPVASATTTSGMVMYTGAASNVKAGMGFAAMFAGAALVL